MRILVPADGSDASLNALRYTLGLRDVHKEGIHIEVLNVQPSMRAVVAQFIDKHVIEEFHFEQGEEAWLPPKLWSMRHRLTTTSPLLWAGWQRPSSNKPMKKRDAIVMGRSGWKGLLNYYWVLPPIRCYTPQISPLRLFPDRVSSRHHCPLAS